MKDFENIKRHILDAETICIAAHTHADGDAIGSTGAMYHFLKEIGKEVYMVLPDMQETFNFLPNIEERVEEVPLDSYDLLICLDVSNNERINISLEDKKKARNIIAIDHHRNNMVDADIKYVDEDAPANCEIIYDLIKYMNHEISKNIAEYIYTGLITDTGSFNFERTTSKTHKIAGEMIDCKIDSVKICKILNHTYSEARMKLLAHLITNMETYFDGRVRISMTDLETKQRFNVKEQDVQSMVNNLIGIEGTLVAIYIRALDEGGYKVSIRASEPIDASEICLQFGGGGHKRAAGFSTYDIENAKTKLIEILERLLESEDNRNT